MSTNPAHHIYGREKYSTAHEILVAHDAFLMERLERAAMEIVLVDEKSQLPAESRPAHTRIVEKLRSRAGTVDEGGIKASISAMDVAARQELALEIDSVHHSLGH